jgi:Leucine-rich repeat (LRR) protein
VENVSYSDGDYLMYQEMEFFNCDMEKLPNNLFKYLPRLDSLMIQKSLRRLEKDSFMENQHLKEISLLETALKVLQNETFFHCRKLNLLEIIDSKLETIEVDAFLGADKLETLIISNSLISNIDRRIFLPLRLIMEIRIDHSKIYSLEDELFAENKNLKIVNFGSNRLTSLTENVFKGARLEYLYFQRNLFTRTVRFPTANLSFQDNNLTEIWIMEDYAVVVAERNQIQDIICAEFAGLRELYLQINLISDLQCIKDLERLRVLNLSFNKLTNLTSESFSKLIYLDVLELIGNQLYNFDIQWLKPMKFLRTLKVDGLLNYTNINTILPKIDFVSLSKVPHRSYAYHTRLKFA